LPCAVWDSVQIHIPIVVGPWGWAAIARRNHATLKLWSQLAEWRWRSQQVCYLASSSHSWSSERCFHCHHKSLPRQTKVWCPLDWLVSERQTFHSKSDSSMCLRGELPLFTTTNPWSLWLNTTHAVEDNLLDYECLSILKCRDWAHVTSYLVMTESPNEIKNLLDVYLYSSSASYL